MVYSLQQLNELFAEYVDNAQKVFSAFQFVQSGYSKGNVQSLNMKLRRLCKQYRGIAFVLFYSTTASRGRCRREEKRTGKAGHPRTKVDGEPEIPHVHGIVIAVAESAFIKDFSKDLAKYLRKKSQTTESIKQHRKGEITGKYSVTDGTGCYYKYCHRQADNTYRGGEEYDWDYFDDERFCTYDGTELS